jgi:type IV secretion system protein VirD4
MLDEFANIALPDDFCSLLSTMRSREISSVIIIQNLAQIKALFKDTWETIVGNCDSLVYLGGNEASTHKFISELLGKGTIDKKSSGETKGRQGSSSRNYDVLGRELLTPDEARKLDNKKCLIFILGFDPIIDTKYIPFEHPAFSQTADGNGEAYVHSTIPNLGIIGPQFEILSRSAVKYYEMLKEKGENVFIDSLEYEELQLVGNAGLEKRFTNRAAESKQAQYPEEHQTIADNAKENVQSNVETDKAKDHASVRRQPIRGEDTLTSRLVHWNYSEGQKEELKLALRAGMLKNDILNYFYPETKVEEMQRIRSEYMTLSAVN